MRVLTAYIAMYCLGAGFAAAQTWYWQNPLPQGNSLTAVRYLGSNTFVAVGHSETVLLSTDNGFTWSVRNNIAGGTHPFYGLAVTDGTILNTVTGGNYFDPGGELVRSTDGGITWFTHYIGGFEYGGLSFPTTDIGFVVGGGFAGFIVKTTNGGLSWTLQDPPTFDNLYDVDCYDTQLGLASGAGNKILRTTNGGTVWTSITVPSPSGFFDVSFVDATTAYAVGSGGIIKSTNAGQSWVAQTSGSSTQLTAFCAIDPSTVVAVGNDGIILKTTNGGTVWTAQVSGTITGLTGVSFSSPDLGVVVGGSGTILRTTNGGASWVQVSYSASMNQLYGVAFATDLIGVAVGVNGTVLRTTNRGAEWNMLLPVASHTLYGIDFGIESYGVAVGDAGTIIRTSDAGATWQEVISGTSNILTDIVFVDSLLAVAVGHEQTILRSVDAALTWQAQDLGIGSVYRDVSFGDSASGTIVGDEGLILHTTDRGETWVKQDAPPTPESLYLTSVAFFNSMTGVTLGYWTSFPSIFEVIARTTNGGDVWEEVSGGEIAGAMAVGDGLSVTAVGGGTIHESSNGGLTWVSSSSLFATTTSIAYSANLDRFVVGGSGTIISTTQGAVSVGLDPPGDIPVTHHLSQNYPNPFNSISNFEFRISNLSNVSLKIFDLLGREVATLVSEKLAPGIYTRHWDATGFSSGVYFYRLQSGDFMQTRKLVLLR
jgi:photosystem II stability/assembly factor-like uncharacterized protein